MVSVLDFLTISLGSHSCQVNNHNHLCFFFVSFRVFRGFMLALLQNQAARQSCRSII
jgi:hypothetical protein